jgi:hypothetical protein
MRHKILVGTLLAGMAALAVMGGVMLYSIKQQHDSDLVVLHGAMTVLPPRAVPYRITQTLIVGPGQTLRIQPGARLEFAPGAGLRVQGGTLAAEGTARRPIIFTATGDPSLERGNGLVVTWPGIQIAAAHDGTRGHAQLAGVTIRYAGNDAGAASITCHAGSLTLVNSTQSDSAGLGLSADAACWGEVIHTTFLRNLGDAARIANAGLRFRDNDVTGEGVWLPWGQSIRKGSVAASGGSVIRTVPVKGLR